MNKWLLSFLPKSDLGLGPALSYVPSVGLLKLNEPSIFCTHFSWYKITEHTYVDVYASVFLFYSHIKCVGFVWQGIRNLGKYWGSAMTNICLIYSVCSDSLYL